MIDPTPTHPAGSDPNQSRPMLRQRDSWEEYSTDDERYAPKPPKAPKGPSATGPASLDQNTTPSSLRAGHLPPFPQDDVVPPNHGVPHDAFGLDNTQPTPEVLRPGIQRKETNPFLRKKVPERAPAVPAIPTAPTIPTDHFSKLAMADEGVPAPVRPPMPQSRATESSSIYSQDSLPRPENSSAYPRPPGSGYVEDNPWDSPPSHAAGPVQTVLWPDEQGKPAAVLRSPVEMQNDPWAEVTAPPSIPPHTPLQAPPPIPQASTNPFASSTPPIHPSPSSSPARIPTPGQVRPTGTPSKQPLGLSSTVSLPSDDEEEWAKTKQDDKGTPPSLPPVPIVSNPTLIDGEDIWGDVSVLDKDKRKGPALSHQAAPGFDDWNLIDVGSPSTSSERFPQTSHAPPPGPPPGPPPRAEPGLSDSKPPASFKGTDANERWVSPRPPVDGKTETYQVKKIHWHDAKAPGDGRVSPILVQNANGPCPLVALVNALSLTTPPDHSDGALVEVLRSREQVSLNLLLDAVFEELMSPRRMDEDGSLPDITDLYAFLQSLHTGMNVNPRFIPTQAMREAFERTSLTHLSASERSTFIPGTFENTQEMGLYATFKVPLIHGWLPPASDPAYEALERQGASYEDAQNLLFREEELERKLSNSSVGLTETEQQLYQDIFTIKNFLDSSATQLTSWGIQVISKAIRPGTFAILFRNDHFSTLYCHPQTKQLVTLVTDDGYRSHEEVVWESLVDINGERTQYLSGDFRVVGTGGQGGSSSFGGYTEGGEWTTVHNKRGKGRQQEGEEAEAEAEAEAGPALSSAEQEDRDLALALQLQEEEDQRHREEESRRQRERDLSNRVIEQQGRQPYRNVSNPPPQTSGVAGIVPARRSSHTLNTPNNSVSSSAANTSTANTSTANTSTANTSTANTSTANTSNPPMPPRPATQTVRPLVPPRRNNMTNRTEDSADAPPPYEQAAHDEPYIPPPGHPNHAGSSPAMSRQSTRSSLPPPRQGQRPIGQSAPGFRPTSQYPRVLHAGSRERERDRDCIVM